MFASFGGHTEIVRLLLEKGAAVDLVDKDGWSALMFAYSKNHTEIIRMLLKKGATIDLKNKEGLTAGELADLLEKNIKADEAFWDIPSLEKKRILIIRLKGKSIHLIHIFIQLNQLIKTLRIFML